MESTQHETSPPDRKADWVEPKLDVFLISETENGSSGTPDSASFNS
ncbi:MAG TPA: hypothetical protein VFE13_14030 [Caulobacteraceae bacterium]|jgi:hypothetical protein|nr:hypothetical protein [Caulobacteraceae bacterium]